MKKYTHTPGHAARLAADTKSRPCAPQVRHVRESKALVKFGLQPETVYRPHSAGKKCGVIHFSV
jgi:hypothetical protein